MIAYVTYDHRYEKSKVAKQIGENPIKSLTSRSTTSYKAKVAPCVKRSHRSVVPREYVLLARVRTFVLYGDVRGGMTKGSGHRKVKGYHDSNHSLFNGAEANST